MPAKVEPGLRIRKLADRSEGERVYRYNPDTGERSLVNPETNLHEPWPFLGIQIEGDAPKKCMIPTSFAFKGQAEGWLTLEGLSMAHAPGGPPEDPWRVTHSFAQADKIILHTVDGDVVYNVVHNPDKYDDEKEPSGKRVDWFYRVELEG
jgi:hypothetical protein